MIRSSFWNWLRSRTPKNALPSLRRIAVEPLEDRLAPAAHTWNPAATSGLWSNAANWSVGGQPLPGEASVQLTFGASTQTNVTNDVANLSFSNIAFNAGAPAYTLNLNTGTQNTQAGGLGIQNNSAATETINGTQPLNLVGIGGNLTVVGSGNINLGVLLAGVNDVSYNGTGTLFLVNPANTYTGPTFVSSGGTINAATLANGGSPSSIGASSNVAQALGLFGGTLQYTGAVAVSTDRLFSVTNGSGTIDASGSIPAATVSFTNPGVSSPFNGFGVQTLVLKGSNTGNNTMANVLADASAGPPLFRFSAWLRAVPEPGT
jgi:fibronectin-binding autotransporter adhesin